MAIVLVQSAVKNVSAVNNTTLAFTSNVTGGNLLLVSIVTYQSTAGTSITTPTDTLAHTYLPVTAQQADTGDVVHLRSWYVANTNPGANTVTADMSGVGTGEITLIVSEWSGLATSSPLSGTPQAPAAVSTTTPTTGNMTPADNNCVLIGVLNAGGTAITITPAGGWTQVREYEGTAGTVTLSMVYKIQTGATAEAASWTISIQRTCVNHIMAFKPVPAATTISVSPSSITAGGTITVTWSGIVSPTSSDWMALYTPGAGVGEFGEWIYVSCSQITSTPFASGSCPFVVPAGQAAGTYEMRLLYNDTPTVLAISNSFTVTAAPSSGLRYSTLELLGHGQ